MKKLKELIKTRFCILLYAVFSVIVITVCIFAFGKINGIMVSFFVVGIAPLMHLANKTEKEEQKELSKRPFESNNVKKYASYKNLYDSDCYEREETDIIDDTIKERYPNSGEEYEVAVSEWLRTQGYYDIYLTATTGDYGVDITARNGYIKYAIQCKYYSDSVGVSAVQQVIAGMAHYQCNRGMVITNSYFTKNAIKLARENGVVLLEHVTPLLTIE